MSYKFGVKINGGSSPEGGLINEKPIATATNIVGKNKAANGARQSRAKCHNFFVNSAAACFIGVGFGDGSEPITSTPSNDENVPINNKV